MEESRRCSLCSTNLASQFCICSNLPQFCSACKATHETKPGFHFSLPLAGLDYVTPQNQSQYKVWLVCLSNSQEKLLENLPLIDQCRREIEAKCGHFQDELGETKAEILQTLDQLQGNLTESIQAAIHETSANAYLGQYQPSTYLATLVWTHSSANSAEPISLFTYQVKPEVQHFLGISFSTPVPEISHLNYGSQKVDLEAEIQTLNTKVAEIDERNETLLKRLEEKEAALRHIKARKTRLKRHMKSLKTQLVESARREEESAGCFHRLQGQFEQATATLAARCEALEAQLSAVQSQLVLTASGGKYCEYCREVQRVACSGADNSFGVKFYTCEECRNIVYREEV